MKSKSVHALISGRVQGVWYRDWTVRQAREHGLKGWVRNLRDGRVEAVFVGEEDMVDQMIALCWEGSPLSKVTEVATNLTDMPTEAGFLKRPSAEAPDLP